MGDSKQARPSPPVGTKQHLAKFVLACVHTVLCTGVAYGWTALVPVLRDDREPFLNDERDSTFHMVGSYGICANFLVKLPAGFMLDRCGPRATAVLGGIILAAGSLLMALGERNSVFQISFGYFLLGCAGPFIQMPCMQFTARFGKLKGTAMSLLVTGFELSTGVFVVFDVVNKSYGVTARSLFLMYTGVAMFIVITALAVWPDAPLDDVKADHSDPRTPAPAPPPMHLKPLQEQLCTMTCLYAFCFITVSSFRQGVFIGSVPAQTLFNFDSATEATLNKAFSIILPLGFSEMLLLSMLGVAGSLLAHREFAYIVTNTLGVLYGILLAVPTFGTFIAAFLLLPLTRQLVFSLFFSTLSNEFGFSSFGRIMGILSTTAGVVQIVFQPMLIAWAMRNPNVIDHHESTRWCRLNLLLAALVLPLMWRPLSRMYQSRQRQSGPSPSLDSTPELWGAQTHTPEMETSHAYDNGGDVDCEVGVQAQSDLPCLLRGDQLASQCKKEPLAINGGGMRP